VKKNSEQFVVKCQHGTEYAVDYLFRPPKSSEICQQVALGVEFIRYV